MKRGFLALLLFLSACNRVDNFFLGEDNTEPPAPLKPFHEKLAIESAWKVKTGYGLHNEYVTLRPAIAKDRVITADVKGNIVAVDRKTGKPLWTATLQQGVSSGPVLRQNIILVGTRKGQVIALSSTNGQAIWKAEVSNEILSRPVLTSTKALVQTIDGKLYAFDLQNGSLLWRYDHNNPSMILRAGGAPAISDDQVIAGFADGRLVAINVENGQLLWVRAVVRPEGGTDVQRMVDIAATPVIKNDTLYVATFQGQLTAITLSSGNILWQRKLSVYEDLALEGSVLYATDSRSRVWAFDRFTGKVMWKQEQLRGRNLTAPLIEGNHLIVADASGYVHVLSKSNGQFLGRQRVTLLSGIRATPQISHQHLFVLLNNGDLENLIISPIKEKPKKAV